MRKFAKSEIDEWRRKFVQRGYPKMELELIDRTIEYFVMPQYLFSGIPNGLFRVTGDFEDSYLVGVSEEIPPILKPYFAISEYDEFMVYGLGDSDRTLHSERDILRMFKNPVLRDFYIENKLKLYIHILEHSRENLGKWGFTTEDYFCLKRGVKFLERNYNTKHIRPVVPECQ